jgi:hypothetical protein
MEGRNHEIIDLEENEIFEPNENGPSRNKDAIEIPLKRKASEVESIEQGHRQKSNEIDGEKKRPKRKKRLGHHLLIFLNVQTENQRFAELSFFARWKKMEDGRKFAQEGYS